MAPIISALAGMAGEWVSDWKAKKQNQRDIERATAENRIRLAESAQTHNEEWEMRALEGRDAFLRRTSFIAWSAPIAWAAVDSPGAAAFFRDALGALPDWYVGGYLAITGAVWGIAELKAMGAIKR